MFISNFVNNVLLILLSVLTANKPKIGSFDRYTPHTWNTSCTDCTWQSRATHSTVRPSGTISAKTVKRYLNPFITFSGLFLPIHVCTFIFSTDKTDKQIRLQNALANFSCCTSVFVISSVHFYLILSTHTHEHTSIVTVYFKWLRVSITKSHESQRTTSHSACFLLLLFIYDVFYNICQFNQFCRAIFIYKSNFHIWETWQNMEMTFLCFFLPILKSLKHFHWTKHVKNKDCAENSVTFTSKAVIQRTS